MILLGNDQDNSELSPNLTDLKKDRDYTMHGKGGDDIFFNHDSTNFNQNITVKDFNNTGDRVNLWKEQYASREYNYIAKNYRISDNNGEKQIILERCLKLNIVGLVSNCSEKITVKLDGEGSRVDQLSDPQALQESFGLVKYR